MEGALGGHTYGVEVTGTAKSTLHTANNTITFVSESVSGTIAVSVDKTPLTSAPLSLKGDPVRYTCEGNTLTEHADGFDTTLTRQG